MNVLYAILALGGLAAALGLILGIAAQRFRVESDPVVDQIDALLPQTQCGQCSYPGCRPYAEAIADGEADINRCPPGGEATVRALADLLDRDPKPLEEEEQEKTVAVIDENICIGCTLCIQACRWTRFSGPPSRCTRSSRRSAPAANSASNPVRWTVSRWFR